VEKGVQLVARSALSFRGSRARLNLHVQRR
jgi:hypothetical protein